MEVSRDKKIWMITEEVKPFFVYKLISLCYNQTKPLVNFPSGW